MEPKQNKTVVAAIAAAVTSYLQAEKQEQASTVEASTAVPTLGPTVNFYGASGRQQMMEMRRLLCLRIGRR